MKLLNLDSIQTPTREVILFGKTYSVNPLCVGHLIESLQISELAKEKDNEGIFMSMVRTAKYALPDADESVIHKLTTGQLRLLIEFINARDEDLLEESSVDGDKAESEKK